MCSSSSYALHPRPLLFSFTPSSWGDRPMEMPSLSRGRTYPDCQLPRYSSKKNAPSFPSFSPPVQPPLPKLRTERIRRQTVVVPKQTGYALCRKTAKRHVFDSISWNDNTHYFLPGRIFVEDCEPRSASIADWLSGFEMSSNRMFVLGEEDIYLLVRVMLWRGNFLNGVWKSHPW